MSPDVSIIVDAEWRAQALQAVAEIEEYTPVTTDNVVFPNHSPYDAPWKAIEREPAIRLWFSVKEVQHCVALTASSRSTIAIQ